MKLSKWLTPLLITSLASSGVCFITISCGGNNSEEWTDETPYEYIYNRTFSIEKIANNYVVWGTCWIIDDSTPQNDSDYAYYIATNWHVTHGFDIIDNAANEYKYADDSLKGSDGWIDYENYKPFLSYEQLDDQNFLYNDEEQTEYFKKGIDLHVCNVNFGSPSDAIKNKLNKINSIRKKYGKINKFVNSDNEDIINKRKIVGGYPEYDNGRSGPMFRGGGKWEFHDDITTNKLMMLNRKELYFTYPNQTDKQFGHPIGQPKFDQSGILVPSGYYEHEEEFYFYDISPQYCFNSWISPTWMVGGASGSMLITEDCEVCGIYWGGEATVDGTGFKPYFSLLKTLDYDFTQQWLN